MSAFISLHGEMDITRVFGTRFEGSNPSGGTNNNLLVTLVDFFIQADAAEHIIRSRLKIFKNLL